MSRDSLQRGRAARERAAYKIRAIPTASVSSIDLLSEWFCSLAFRDGNALAHGATTPFRPPFPSNLGKITPNRQNFASRSSPME